MLARRVRPAAAKLQLRDAGAIERVRLQSRAVFDCGELDAPAELARSLLTKAPESIRKLFTRE